MLIIPEQLPSLFEEIDRMKWNAFQEGMNPSTKNYDNIEGIGRVNLNYGVETNFQESYEELMKVLEDSTIISDRNFDFIDVGTAFYGRWMDEQGNVTKPQRLIMVGKYLKSDLNSDYEFVSMNSALGEAVMGKTAGDICSYEADSKKHIFFIDSIDDNLSNYIQFGQSSKGAK